MSPYAPAAMPLARFLCVCVAVGVTLSGALPAQRGLNLLFYGNSYTIDNWTVTRIVDAIANDANQPPPTIVPRLFGGTSLVYHRNDPAQVAAISTSLPAGQHWDYVVMQGNSLEATVSQGDPAAFRAHALGILQNVRAHSPAARAVLYQTWARAPGHPLYPAAFPNPWAMHAEVRRNYELAADDINQAFGPDTARVARVGDAVARLGFDPAYYNPDLSHPSQDVTLLAAMAIYTAIYGAPLCAMAPDFSGPGRLALHFSTYGFAPASWPAMRGFADLIAARSLRRFPGSDEDLLLRSGGANALDVCPLLTALRGGTLRCQLTTPVGRYATAAGVVFLDRMPQGPQPGFPELHFSPGAAVLLGSATTLGQGLTVTVPIPATMAMVSVFVQAAALAPSANMTNAYFTTTDGHEVRLR